jgi:hypothetical protein
MGFTFKAFRLLFGLVGIFLGIHIMSSNSQFEYLTAYQDLQTYISNGFQLQNKDRNIGLVSANSLSTCLLYFHALSFIISGSLIAVG